MHIKSILTPLLLLSCTTGLYSPSKAASTHSPQTTSPSSPDTITINPTVPDEAVAAQYHIVLDFSNQTPATDGFFIYPLWQTPTIEALNRKLTAAHKGKSISTISLMVTVDHLIDDRYNAQLRYWLRILGDQSLTSFLPKLVIIGDYESNQQSIAEQFMAITSNEEIFHRSKIVYDDLWDEYAKKNSPPKEASKPDNAQTVNDLITALTPRAQERQAQPPPQQQNANEEEVSVQNGGHLVFSFSGKGCTCAFVSAGADSPREPIQESPTDDIKILKASVEKCHHKPIASVVLELSADKVLGNNFDEEAELLAPFIQACGTSLLRDDSIRLKIKDIGHNDYDEVKKTLLKKIPGAHNLLHNNDGSAKFKDSNMTDKSSTQVNEAQDIYSQIQELLTNIEEELHKASLDDPKSSHQNIKKIMFLIMILLALYYKLDLRTMLAGDKKAMLQSLRV